MTDDPAGYYATLEVEPTAAPEAITAAFRRRVRLLHPDVIGTGSAEAFIRVKAAYDVVGDAARRAAYDRAAREARAAQAARELAFTEEDLGLELAPRARGRDLPVGLWAAIGGIFCLATVMVVRQFNHPPVPASGALIRPFAPPAADGGAVPKPEMPAAPAGGPTTHFVLPAQDSAAVLWQRGTARDAFLPAGRLAAFTPVRALRLVPEHGLVEIALGDSGDAFIDAMRLTPGNAAAARRAFCAYNAGPAPQSGEVLRRNGDGAARVEISNRAPQPAVVKLRDTAGRTAATVFVAPGDRAVVANLPDQPYRPDFAIGELWSRACNDFAAGTRAQRFAGFASPQELSPLTIPPGVSAVHATVDIPDTVFERE